MKDFRFFFLFALFFVPVWLWGQPLQRCHADEVRMEHQHLEPNVLRKAPKRIEFAEKQGGVRKIPVVVHIIQSSSTVQITDARVQTQINVLNEDYRRMNADSVNTRATFQGVAADTEIEFCLASIDPDGCPHPGINRIVSPLADHVRAQESQLKALVQWDPYRYLNIWVPETSSGQLIGYSTFPQKLDTLPQMDGVVIQGKYFGRGAGVPLSDFDLGRTGTHEIGHWLGLEHPWLSGCSGMTPSSCATFGDYICDTPPQATDHLGGCPTTENTCSETPNLPDMVENFMQWTQDDCMNLFTRDQRDRMHYFLDSVRADLWSPANLTATGCDGTVSTGCGPFTDFVADFTNGCTGLTVTFTDLSTGLPNMTAWDWDFGDAGTSTLQNPTHTYNTPGAYTVSLTATNQNGQATESKIDYINIGQGFSIPLFEGLETTAFPPANWVVEDLDNEGTWVPTTDVSRTGNASTVIKNYELDSQGSADNLVFPLLDLRFATSATLTFQLAYKEFGYGGNPSNPDRLKVEISTNCGSSWHTLFDESGAGLATTPGFDFVAFMPDTTQWELINLDLANYLGSSQTYLRFQNLGVNGQNLYLDDINLNGVVSREASLTADFEIEVYPVPAQDELRVGFANGRTGEIRIEVRDAQGRLRYADNFWHFGGSVELPIAVDGWASGLYFLQLKSESGIVCRKVLIGK